MIFTFNFILYYLLNKYKLNNRVVKYTNLNYDSLAMVFGI